MDKLAKNGTKATEVVHKDCQIILLTIASLRIHSELDFLSQVCLILFLSIKTLAWQGSAGWRI